MKIIRKQKWIIVLTVYALVVIYLYISIIGINIINTRKEMAKPIPLEGEMPYMEDNLKEQETLVLSISMGLGTHGISISINVLVGGVLR